jgi:hypothetical protein
MANTSKSDDRGRFSARRKTDAVLRLLRGEDLDLLSRELGVTAATLSGWRDDFLAGGRAALKSRPADDRDDEIARLRDSGARLPDRPGTRLRGGRGRGTGRRARVDRPARTTGDYRITTGAGCEIPRFLAVFCAGMSDLAMCLAFP